MVFFVLFCSYNGAVRKLIKGDSVSEIEAECESIREKSPREVTNKENSSE